MTPRGAFFVSVEGHPLRHQRINQREQDDRQSERTNYAHHDLVSVGPVQFIYSWQKSLESSAARARFRRAVLVLRMLRRPAIAPVVRPNAGPINTCGLPAALDSRSRLSSSEVHGLLLFFGIDAIDNRKGNFVTNLPKSCRFLFV
jgi:hypothetical protein